MNVKQFRIERYRSILKSEALDLRTMTVLVGPNNEGKSNILRGLVVGLRVIADYGAGRTAMKRRILGREGYDFELYSWETDLPASVKETKPQSATVLEFEFELSQEEIAEFKKRIRSSTNGTLKVRLRLYGDRRELEIVKKGPGSKTLNAKSVQVAKFISERIRVQYIPASRPAQDSIVLMRSEVNSRLAALEQDSEYLEALDVVLDRRRNALTPLGSSVTSALKRFLPNVKSVELEPAARDSLGLRPWGSTGFDFIVDDGVKTPLASKGDGVQSLAAISLAHSLATTSSATDMILAVEEPEAHLHPAAIHELRAVLNEIAEGQQVVITTHSPLLVNRNEISGNVIIKSNRAVPAASLGQVREALGVRVEDNLQSASVALLVEGFGDLRIIRALLRSRSEVLNTAIKDGRLRLEVLTGASNAAYQFRRFYDSVCRVHVVLDDDNAGRKALESLEKEQGFERRDATVISMTDMNESEIEDLLDENLLRQQILDTFNVVLTPENTHPSKRFGLRMKDHFTASGQGWTKKVEEELKTLVADLVEDEPLARIRTDRMGPIDATIRELESKLVRT